MSDTESKPAERDAALRRDNRRMLGKLVVVATLMAGFGYALVPIYNTICSALGINVLSLAEIDVQGGKRADAKSNTQVDTSTRGPLNDVQPGAPQSSDTSAAKHPAPSPVRR